MTANRQLAAQRAISQENIEAIDSLHNLLERLIALYTLEIPYEEARDLVRSANMTLSNLWGFTYDSAYDTWTPRFEQRHMELVWVGKTYRCADSGVTYKLGKHDCYERSFVLIGKSGLDLGVAGGYHRIIGNLVEITE